jgi:hypothetical protein
LQNLEKTILIYRFLTMIQAYTLCIVVLIDYTHT